MNENCRLCLGKLETTSVAIADEGFREKLKKVFEFMIFTDETHPGQACQPCHSLVSQFYEFSLQVEENQQQLWAQHLYIKVEDVKEEEDTVPHSFYHVDVDALPPEIVKQEPTEPSVDTDGYIGIKDNDDSDDDLHVPHTPAGYDYEEDSTDSDYVSTTATSTAANSNYIQHRIYPRGIAVVTNRVYQPARGTETEIDQHLKEFYNFQCEVCSAKLGNMTILRSHFRLSHGMEGFIRCCGIRLYTRIQLRDHMDEHDGTQPTCKICNTTHKNHKSLKMHMSNYHRTSDELTFKCPKCWQEFATKYLLRMHLPLHSTVKCLHCGKVLLSKSVKSHMAKMHNPGKYTCAVCGIKFRTKRTLWVHKNNVHMEFETFKCEFCDKQFKRKVSLRDHMASHGR
ncbi:transcription factor grauzone-like [Anopheles albimanus]|uniref:Protein krueppel n=1 Tax=Anopheles albimanus TaxID=7167 RepID=A0A182FFB8_ANOAL|nr:transcription factor grauzone-like [Anopheles albimanus]